MPLVACTATGCNDRSVGTSPSIDRSVKRTVSHFNPETAGEISGEVIWHGPIPSAPPFETQALPTPNEILGKKQLRANPNLPKIDPSTHGVANAVVYLRNAPIDQSKPWDHPPVRVEMRGCEFHIVQGTADSGVGFVRLGDMVQMISVDKYFHLLHAAGAAFWNYAFPDPGMPLSRELDKSGIVELSSGAGYYWMRAYLFVAEHPYFTRTDKDGRFTLPQVPPGHYEAVCWLPNWRKAGHERDPESGTINRWFFCDPIETTCKVDVAQKRTSEIQFGLSDKCAR
jgi:hypothetical protein